MNRFISLQADDGHKFQAYESGSPDSPHAVVVVQEIFGLTANIQATCEHLGRQGFHAIAPAIFDRAMPDQILGYEPDDIEKGLKLRSQIPLDLTLKDLTACADYLARPKTGIIGFCWGGRLAWDAATLTRRFSAAVSWYGGGIADSLARTVHCPVQLHFGGEDHSIPHMDISKIRETHPETEIYVYDNAGHGFGNADRHSWNAEAASLAWKRSTDFLEACLRTE